MATGPVFTLRMRSSCPVAGFGVRQVLELVKARPSRIAEAGGPGAAAPVVRFDVVGNPCGRGQIGLGYHLQSGTHVLVLEQVTTAPAEFRLDPGVRP